MRMGNESRLKVGWGRGKWVTREKAVTEERRWGPRGGGQWGGRMALAQGTTSGPGERVPDT